jgi:transposase
LTHGLRFLQNSHRGKIAAFLGVAPSLVNSCKAQAGEDKTAEARREMGRPAFLRTESKQVILDWLERRAATRNWLIPTDFKEQIIAELERNGIGGIILRSYHRRCLERLVENTMLKWATSNAILLMLVKWATEMQSLATLPFSPLLKPPPNDC